MRVYWVLLLLAAAVQGAPSAPSFIPGPDIVTYENRQDLSPVPPVPTYTYANWAKGINISAGAWAMALQFFWLTNSNSAMFAVQPAIDNQGTLTFTLNRNVYGNSTVTVTMCDNTAPAMCGAPITVGIMVYFVNQPPTFSMLYNPITIPQNYGAVSYQLWANNIAPGPASEVSQVWMPFVVADTSFFTMLPTIRKSPSGTTASLDFTVAPNTYGTTTVSIAIHDDGGTLYGGSDTTLQTLTIIVTPINLAPSFTLASAQVAVLENQYNSGYTQQLFARDVSPGQGENIPTSSLQVAQSVSFTVSADPMTMFAVQPSVSPVGTLTFATARNAYGIATVTVKAVDSFVPPATYTTNFTIAVQHVTQPPTFDLSGDLTGLNRVLMCNTGCARTIPNFMRSLVIEPVNPVQPSSTASLLPPVTTCDTAIFDAAVTPQIDVATGAFTFTLKTLTPTPLGKPAFCTVTATTAANIVGGGTGTTSRTFYLEVYAQPAPPSFTGSTGLVAPLLATVNENSGIATFASWATNIMASPTTASTAGLYFTLVAANPSLFAVQPTIIITTSQGQTSPGVGTLTFTPAVNMFGVTTVTAYLTNSLTSQVSDAFPFIITIANVNQKPTFNTIGDVLLNQDSGAQVINWASSISAGPNEDATQQVAFSIACQSNSLFTTAGVPQIDTSGVLSLTLAAGQSGSTACTVIVIDSLKSGVSSFTPQTVTVTMLITVRRINQQPTYVPGADINMTEATYSNSRTTIHGWASSIKDGATNPTQTLTFVVTAQDPSWFDVQPRIDAVTGTLTFTLKPFQAGVTYLTHQLQNSGSNVAPDSNISPARKMQLVIIPVNQPPTFVLGPNVQVLQNSGFYRAAGWATQMSPGPANEATQTLTFTLLLLDSTTSQWFMLPPSVNVVTGDLTFSTAANQAGTTTVSVCLVDNGGTANGGVPSTCKSMTIAITAVNQPPTAASPSQVVVLQNAAFQTIPNFLTSVAAGPSASDGTQFIKSVTCSVSLANQLLFAVQPTIALNTWTLTFQPALNAVGLVTVTYTITDSGDTANGGSNTVTQSFDIKIVAVNGAPTFTAGPAVTVKANSGTYYALWATAISPGPSSDASQALDFIVSVDQPSWFSVQPTVSAGGYLSFTVNPNVFGVVNTRIVLRDNGGTAYNGTDTSMPVLTTITISFVNQAPSFTMGPDLTVLQGLGPFRYAGWATNIIAGPPMEDLAQHAGLAFVLTAVDTTMFSVQPAIDATTGDLTFTTAVGRFGDTQVAVVLKDAGGTANGGVDTSVSRLLTVRVQNVNQAPSVTTQGDITVLENSGDQVIKGWIISTSPGPGETATQTTTLSLTNDSPQLFASPPRLIGNDMYFTPATNANGMATLTLNVSDNGGTANGGINRATSYFRLMITFVNQAPTFAVGNDITVQENSGTTTVASWMTKISGGALNEASQTLTGHFAVDRSDILVGLPTVSTTTGMLTFAVQQYAFGTVIVSVWLSDNGGTSNNGQDTSVIQTFRITVTNVNQAPTFMPGPPVIVANNAVLQYSIPWASNVSAGPREDSVQSVAFSISSRVTALFSATGQPTMTNAGLLAFTLAPGAVGNTTLTITLRDSAGGSSSASYVQLTCITVNVNTNIVMTLNAVYSTFNLEQFRQIIANDLGISVSQVIIISVAPGSVIVTFQVLSDSAHTSDYHTQLLLAHAQDSTSSLNQQITIMAVSTTPAGSSTGPSTTGGGGSSSSGDTNYVALGVGLAAAFLVITLIVIAGVIVYRRRQERKRQDRFRQAAVQKSGSSNHPYEYEDSAPPTGKANPIHQKFAPVDASENGDGVYVGREVDPFEAGSRSPYQHSPSRKRPASFVPVMTPSRVYAQPSPRLSRWPAAGQPQQQY